MCRFFRSIFLLLLISVFVPNSLYAAGINSDSPRSWSSESQSSQTSGSSAVFGNDLSPLTLQNAGDNLSTQPTKDEQMIRLLEEREQSQGMQIPTDFDSSAIEGIGSIKNTFLPDKQNTQKTQLLVKSEPGDGLVKLSWTLVNPPPRREDNSLRFTIRYGVESGKLINSRMLGTTALFVLRELKNFHPYYIQVVALDKQQKTLVKSDEIEVIPLPDGEQSSQLEKSFSKKAATMLDKIEPEPMRRDLKQFGYDFFKNTLQVTSAIDSMPAATDYQLGPGDVLNLNVWGAVSFRLELDVNRNGELSIPKVGQVRVWGLTLNKAQTAINDALSRSYRNFEMSLILGKLRSIQVYVVGEIAAPGNYPISSLATVINALAAAGGPTRNGSLRAVRITRGNKVIATVDLYDILLSGDRNMDMQLQNGDTIFVPVIGPVVAVTGEVRRPAIFELKGKTNLPEILRMAGGVSASASLARIQIERIENNNSRIALDYSLKTSEPQKEMVEIEVKDRDMVKIYPIQSVVRQVVVLKGNVQQAGEYQFRKAMRLTDLIPSTKALLPESHLDSVEIVRMSPPDFRRELITVSLRGALAGNQADNLLLQEQDTVRVFSRWEMEEKPKVGVNGAVINPGTFDFYPGMTVRDLVASAGSVRRNAFFERAELSRIVVTGDKAQSTRQDIDLGKALAGDPVHNLSLQSDDVLIVRGISNWQEATEKFIVLKGEVRFPGVYSIASNEKLSSVIKRAGGFTEKAYLRGAKFTRRSVREMQQKRMDEIIARSEKDILQKQASVASVSSSKEELDATKAALDSLLKSMERMKSLKAEGRVVMRLSALDAKTPSNYDLALEGGDQLEIPSRPSVVSVLGQVYNPTSFIYLPDKDIDAYLQRSGGALNNAEKSEMYVIRADGTVMSRQQFSFGFNWSDDGWSFGSFLSAPLEAGDTLVVPQKLEKIAWMREIKDITQILANVALTTGTLWAIVR